MIDEAFNQTQFAEEEPLFETIKYTEDTNVQAKKNKPKTLFLALGSVFMTFIGISVGLVILFRSTSSHNQQQQPTPTPKTQVYSNAFEQLLQEIQKEVNATDPKEELLSFPPIETQIQMNE